MVSNISCLHNEDVMCELLNPATHILENILTFRLLYMVRICYKLLTHPLGICCCIRGAGGFRLFKPLLLLFFSDHMQHPPYDVANGQLCMTTQLGLWAAGQRSC